MPSSKRGDRLISGTPTSGDHKNCRLLDPAIGFRTTVRGQMLTGAVLRENVQRDPRVISANQRAEDARGVPELRLSWFGVHPSLLM